MEIGIDSGSIAVAIGINLLFGIGYAFFVRWVNNRGYMEGYTAFFVVFGVLITLLINQIAYTPSHWLPDLFFELVGFAASGLPMVVENIHAYIAQRAREQLQYGGGHD